MLDTGWVDRTAYPFAPHSFEIDGARMHYVDEGEGPPILLLHGTPAWSFLYRDLIRTLAPTYRCIAPDHLGFGLSDKPEHAAYKPIDHARRLRALIEHLGLRDFTLVVHDFGGPIGLSYAVEQPHNVRALVVFNTWMWSLRGDPVARLASLAGGRVGAFLFRRFNVEARLLFKWVWGKPSALRAAVHQQYIKPFPRPGDRMAMWVLARELLHSGDWYDSLWQRRQRIENIPALVLWGSKDPVVNKRHLARWQALFPHARTVVFPNAGHFVQEEERERVGVAVRQFLDEQHSASAS